MSEPIIGIDLGTTNSVVAAVIDGVPTVIASRGGYRLTPSVVAFAKNGKRLIGALAKRQAVTNAENTVFAAKRLIGRKWETKQVQELLPSLPYRVAEGPHGDVRVHLADKDYAIPEISAMVLSELRLDAEAYFGQPVGKAVITVPAHFNDMQRQATKDAGRIAGLDVLRIINEPTSASLAYGFGKTLDQKVAVFDLGGGTFDVSILDVSNGVFEVIATGGDTALGGEDFDNRIVEWLVFPFAKENKLDLRKDRMALQRLKDAAEKSKMDLSTALETEINLPFIITDASGRALHLHRTLTRAKLEDLTSDLADRCIRLTEKTLAEAGLRKGEVEEVVLVGGMTRMPRVQDGVKKFFGKEPNKGVHPDEVVALGAAIHAASLVKESSEMLLLDVTPHSLGIHIVGGYFQTVIPKNTTVPTTARHLFTTVTDNQASAKIMVLQGESERSEVNELLGEFMLTGLRQAARGQVEIEVIFEISADGLVSVSARDTVTGQRQSITVTATSGLSEDEVKAMMEAQGDYMLAAKTEDAFETVRATAEQAIAELAALRGQFEAAAAGAEFAPDALRRADASVDSAREAIRQKDATALRQVMEKLARTKALFLGVISKQGKR